MPSVQVGTTALNWLYTRMCIINFLITWVLLISCFTEKMRSTTKHWKWNWAKSIPTFAQNGTWDWPTAKPPTPPCAPTTGCWLTSCCPACGWRRPSCFSVSIPFYSNYSSVGIPQKGRGPYWGSDIVMGDAESSGGRRREM